MSDRINRYISILYRYGQRYLSSNLKALNFDVGLMPAFLQACKEPGITQEGISSATGMDKGTTARSVKQLELQGYIIRQVDAMDRRMNHIYPTDRALALYPQIESILIHLHQLLYQGFSEEEKEQALVFVQRMKQNMMHLF